MRGSVIPRANKDGSTTFYIKYRDAEGRQVKRAVKGGRRKAEGELADAVAAVNRGEHRAPVKGRERFGDYAARWLEEHRARLEPGTYRDYEIHLRRRLIPFFGAMKLRAIDTPAVRRYVSSVSGTLSAKTVNNSITVLRVALGHAVEDKLIAANPAASEGRRERIKLPAEHREMDYLRLDEIPAYLEACAPAYRPLAEVLLGTGMRISEALALEWGDVDWRGGAIYARRSLKREGAGSTKGDRSRRVEVGPRLLGVLRDLRAVQSEHRDGDDSAALLFPGKARGERAGYMDRSYISRDLHPQALKRAGLRHIRLHDLRHSAAAAWLAAGLPMIYVQRQLGHRQISTTIGEYGHLEESFLRDAAVRAEQAVWRPEPEPVE